LSAFWWRIAIAGALVLFTSALAKVIDVWIERRRLDPSAATRYGVLRRAIFTTIVFIGVMSALLVIPQVRAVAGAILASGAVVGIVIGFAAQRTLGNFIAGILLAFSQPLRLGDEIEVEGTHGIVEEIALTYTWLRLPNGDRLIVPNERLVSESLRNSTIRADRRLAEVTVHVPLSADLRKLVDALSADEGEAYVSDLGADATLVCRRWIPQGHSLEEAESELRLAVHDRLRELGVTTA